MKKIITILIIIAVIAGGAYAFTRWQAQKKAQAVSSLQTVNAERGQLVATIGATGLVRSNQTATLTWKTSGAVEKVLVKVGQKVKVNDKLAELQQTSLPQNIILAQGDLVSAKKALADLYTTAENAKIQAMQEIAANANAIKNAQYQLDNYSVPAEQASLSALEAVDLMEQRLNEARAAFEPYKFNSESDPTRRDLKEKLDRAQSDYNTAVRRLELEYQLEVAQANQKKARQDYDKWENGPDPDDIAALEARTAAAEATLRQAWIEAPFAGTITLVDILPGDQVNVNGLAFRLDDLSDLIVNVAVSEVDINAIQPGQAATITFDAIRGKEYKGTVVGVDMVGTSEQGVVDFIVEVKLTNADADVKPGMTAAVNIVVNQLEDVLLVPNRAVRFKDGRAVVYVLRNGIPTAVNIQLGASSDTMSEVLESELQVGDPIVLNPPLEFDNNGPPAFAR
jgi:HlyD family secretion protein